MKHLFSWIRNVKQAQETDIHHFKIGILILILLEELKNGEEVTGRR